MFGFLKNLFGFGNARELPVAPTLAPAAPASSGGGGRGRRVVRAPSVEEVVGERKAVAM